MLELIILINLARSQPLIQDKTLTNIAQRRAEYLCDHEFSHVGWNVPTKFNYRGENLAADFPSATSTHKALMNSPKHKANIINPDFQYVGIGEACGITVFEFGGYF